MDHLGFDIRQFFAHDLAPLMWGDRQKDYISEIDFGVWGGGKGATVPQFFWATQNLGRICRKIWAESVENFGQIIVPPPPQIKKVPYAYGNRPQSWIKSMMVWQELFWKRLEMESKEDNRKEVMIFVVKSHNTCCFLIFTLVPLCKWK